jgi:hypothetical protein
MTLIPDANDLSPQPLGPLCGPSVVAQTAPEASQSAHSSCMRKLLVLRLVRIALIALCVAAHQAKAEFIDDGQPSEAELRAWLNSLLPLSDAGWVALASWNGSSVVYVSNRDASREGSVISVRVRWEYLRDADIFGIRYKSSTEQIDFDCLNKQFRFYDLTVYTGNSLTGDRRSVTSRCRRWNPYASGAQFAEVGDAVCSHAASKPNEPSEP